MVERIASVQLPKPVQVEGDHELLPSVAVELPLGLGAEGDPVGQATHLIHHGSHLGGGGEVVRTQQIIDAVLQLFQEQACDRGVILESGVEEGLDLGLQVFEPWGVETPVREVSKDLGAEGVVGTLPAFHHYRIAVEAGKY